MNRRARDLNCIEMYGLATEGNRNEQTGKGFEQQRYVELSDGAAPMRGAEVKISAERISDGKAMSCMGRYC